MNKFLLIIILVSFCNILISQEIGPDGYNKFYYPNGNISSEGYIKDGKPDGYWKSYYEDGTLKSEGNRLFFELDSVWNFYNEDGQLINKITYRKDQKNGYTYIYDFYYTKDSIKEYYLKSKELYYMGSREGLSFYYDKNGNLKHEYTYKSDKRNGDGKEYDPDGLVITLYTYYNGFLIDAIRINRLDKNNLKQGKWIDFHPNGNKKIEANYKNDKLDGVYKEYDLAGRLILEKRYENGLLYTPEEEEEIVLKAEVKKSFYSNGSLQFEGAFLDTLPVGLHKEYNEKGDLIVVKEYSPEGELYGDGLFDENGNRVGKWKLYDNYYNYYYGEGNYEKGLKEGKWRYYYPNGKIEQEGYYSRNRPDREWIWYHYNGNIKIEESYLIGKLEGPFVEYDSIGNVILKGEYFDDARVGEWYYNVGYINEKGSYDFSSKTGEWKQYFNINNKKYFVGTFKNGDPDGTHIWYFPNGNAKLIGEYRAGRKNKEWKKYNEDGTPSTTYTYRNDNLIKIDGKKTINLKKEGLKK